MYDVLIKNASVIDGTGKPAFRANVAILEGKLVMDPAPDAPAREVIDAQGLTLTPGFIDAHSHGDSIMGKDVAHVCKTNQGVTTELVGQCGSSPFPLSAHPDKRVPQLRAEGVSDEESFTGFAQFLEKVDALPKTLHYKAYCGHKALRIAAMGHANRPATRAELDCMKDMLREAMEHGAMGMTSGLIYPPSCYAQEDELVELCQVVAEYNGIYATHMRNEAGDVLNSVKEAISVAERSGCRLDISHHKVCGKANWGKSVQTLELIHQARERGVEITLDVYPYTASSTALNVCMPAAEFCEGAEKLSQRLTDPALRARLRQEMLGMDGRYAHCGGWSGVLMTNVPGKPEAMGITLEDYAKKLGKDPFEAYFDLMVETGCVGQAIYFTMDEGDLKRIMADENAVVGTDGVARSLTAPTHPRGFASFPKAIRYFVREQKLFTLEQMIHKMTGLTAQRFDLKNKGVIAQGYDADLVLFNADEITDRATYTDGVALCDGIDRVIVSGETVWQNKQLTGKFPGKFIPHTL